MSAEFLRRALVYYDGRLAGYLAEVKDGYLFQYDLDFLQNGAPISLSLPLRGHVYESKELFAFFRGLLPEGWYLNIVSKTHKEDKSDLFGILLRTAGCDTIGAVTVKKVLSNET